MNYQVFIASRAQQQLAECARWWAEHRNAEQAGRWLEGLEAVVTLRVKSFITQQRDDYDLRRRKSGPP